MFHMQPDDTTSSLDKQIITFQVPDLECGVCIARHDELAIACNADVDDLCWMFLSTRQSAAADMSGGSGKTKEMLQQI